MIEEMENDFEVILTVDAIRASYLSLIYLKFVINLKSISNFQSNYQLVSQCFIARRRKTQSYSHAYEETNMTNQTSFSEQFSFCSPPVQIKRRDKV